MKNNKDLKGQKNLLSESNKDLNDITDTGKPYVMQDQAPVLLKDQINIIREKEKAENEKKVYSFRLNKKLMDNIDFYTDKEKLNKTSFIEDNLNDFFRNREMERKTFNHVVKVKLENGVCEYINLNNKLDIWDNGTYHAEGKELNEHEGLEIVISENKTYFIYLKYIKDDIGMGSVLSFKYEIISFDKAIKLAITSDNIELQDLIKEFETLDRTINFLEENSEAPKIEPNIEKMAISKEELIKELKEKDNKIKELKELLVKVDPENLKEQVMSEILKEMEKFKK